MVWYVSPHIQSDIINHPYLEVMMDLVDILVESFVMHKPVDEVVPCVL